MLNREKFNQARQHSETQSRRSEAVFGSRFQLFRLFSEKIAVGKFVIPFDWLIDFYEHEFDEGVPSRNLCEEIHYKRECLFCKQTQTIKTKDGKSKTIVNKPKRNFNGLLYFPVNDGAVDHIMSGEYEGRVKRRDPLQLLRFPAGDGDRNYLAFADAHTSGKFLQRYWKFEHLDGQKAGGSFQRPVMVASEDFDEYKIPNEGKLPSHVIDAVRGMKQEDFYAHVLHTFQNADFDYYELEKPEKFDWTTLLVPISETSTKEKTQAPAKTESKVPATKPIVKKEASADLAALLGEETEAPAKQTKKAPEPAPESSVVEENEEGISEEAEEFSGVETDDVDLEALLA